MESEVTEDTITIVMILETRGENYSVHEIVIVSVGLRILVVVPPHLRGT